jgi:hypothetical protein
MHAVGAAGHLQAAGQHPRRPACPGRCTRTWRLRSHRGPRLISASDRRTTSLASHQPGDGEAGAFCACSSSSAPRVERRRESAAHWRAGRRSGRTRPRRGRTRRRWRSRPGSSSAWPAASSAVNFMSVGVLRKARPAFPQRGRLASSKAISCVAAQLQAAFSRARWRSAASAASGSRVRGSKPARPQDRPPGRWRGRGRSGPGRRRALSPPAPTRANSPARSRARNRAGRRHRAHGVRTGRADTQLEEVEDADVHRAARSAHRIGGRRRIAPLTGGGQGDELLVVGVGQLHASRAPVGLGLFQPLLG